MVLEVAEGGGEALVLVEGVLIDSKHLGTEQADAFIGLSLSELGVDAPDGGVADAAGGGEHTGANAVVMVLVDLLTKGLA